MPEREEILGSGKGEIDRVRCKGMVELYVCELDVCVRVCEEKGMKCVDVLVCVCVSMYVNG